MPYCSYYQAFVDRSRTWFVISALRSFEHCAFDRTYDAQQAIVEFFVPHDNEATFLEVMEYLRKEGVVLTLEKLPNRLMDPEAEV